MASISEVFDEMYPELSKQLDELGVKATDTLVERFKSNGKYLNEVLDYDLKDNEKIRSIAEVNSDKATENVQKKSILDTNAKNYFLIICSTIALTYLAYLIAPIEREKSIVATIDKVISSGKWQIDHKKEIDLKPISEIDLKPITSMEARQMVLDELYNIDDFYIQIKNGERVRFVYLTNDGRDSQILSISACLLYTSPSPRDVEESRMPSSA